MAAILAGNHRLNSDTMIYGPVLFSVSQLTAIPVSQHVQYFCPGPQLNGTGPQLVLLITPVFTLRLHDKMAAVKSVYRYN